MTDREERKLRRKFDDEPGNRAGPKRVTIRNETKDMEVEVANNNSGRGIRKPKRLES